MHSLGLGADLCVHLSASESATACKAGDCLIALPIPCPGSNDQSWTRRASSLPTFLGNRKQALWGPCCLGQLRRGTAAQFSKPHSSWRSTKLAKLTCFLFTVDMATWVVQPKWPPKRHHPGRYRAGSVNSPVLSLSRPGPSA